MLPCDQLDALFRLLEEMTLSSRKSVVPTFSRWMQSIGKWLLIGFSIAMVIVVIMVIVAIRYRFAQVNPAHGVAETANIAFLVGMGFAMLYMLTAIADVAYLMWQRRRDRFGTILAPLKEDLLKDARFLTRLQAFDTPTRTYGLVQYRYHYGISDGRVALLAGDIRKIGLFPALTTAAMSAAELLKDHASNPFLWAPLILAGCFYVVGFVLIGGRERAAQVVALLEYSVSQTDEPSEATPAGHVDVVPTQDLSEAPGGQGGGADDGAAPCPTGPA